MTTDNGTEQRTVVMIATPLEAEHVERIAAVDPARVEVIYRPDLMPSTTYQGDHNGPKGWARTPEAEREWRSLLRRADVLWDFSAEEGVDPFEQSPNLRWVQTTSAGVGQMVKRLGVADSDLIVTTASGVHGQALAEFVFGVLLFCEKRFAELQAWQREKTWNRYCGGELADKTIAIVGPGRIGREIARIATAFNMTVHVMARSYDAARAADLNADAIFPRERLHELLGQADAVVLCTPHTPETEGLIGEAEIAAMKPGVILINIARGLVIDEDAMIAALRSGQIGFAGLDVFRTEPLPADSPLWELPNVLINPHSASTAPSENRKITDIFCRNLRLFLDGRYDEMSPILDKQRLY
ncbi:MAG: D-2-hydroxyacid dehydrogenase [Thermomicrobiales bacterium]|nr:D-2-hydroxyacid dehydrogenase [Thermomicrobiales bacterium]